MLLLGWRHRTIVIEGIDRAHHLRAQEPRGPRGRGETSSMEPPPT